MPAARDQEPIDQPIGMLPVTGKLIDESVAGPQEQYATLAQARAKPPVLDDATVTRVERVFREERDWIGVYEQQLARWRTLALTAAQRAEVDRLAGELSPWRAVVEMTLQLAAELKAGTIDAIMRKDDAELGLEVLLGLRPLP